MKIYKKYVDSECQDISTVQDGACLVGGFYGTDTVDVDGHIIFKEDYISKIKEYMPWGNVRNAHQNPIGTIESYDEALWNYITVRISEPTIAALVRDGVYKGFSIGIKADENGLDKIPLNQISPDKYEHLPQAVINRIKRLGYVLRIKDFYISEISITDRPKNTKSVIVLVKGDNEDNETLPSLMEEFKMEDEKIMDTMTPEDCNPSMEESSPEDVPAVKVEIEINEACAPEDQRKEEDAAPDGAGSDSVAVFKSIDLTDVMSIIKDIKAEVDALKEMVTSGMNKMIEGVASNKDAAISKSDNIDIVQAPAIDLEVLKSFISDTLKSEFEDFRKSELSLDRRGTINKGDSGETEKFDSAQMDKNTTYNLIATMIAKNIKK